MCKQHPGNQTKPTYIMVPRKLIIAWFTTTLLLFGMFIGSFQYTNYVDRRSNGAWCGVVALFDDTYREEPPTTETGKRLAAEFPNLRKTFKCK